MYSGVIVRNDIANVQYEFRSIIQIKQKKSNVFIYFITFHVYIYPKHLCFKCRHNLIMLYYVHETNFVFGHLNNFSSENLVRQFILNCFYTNKYLIYFTI